MPDQLPARGHVAQILRFDEETALLPLNESELFRLTFMVRGAINNLKQSGDFPEEKEYTNLLENLKTAHFLISPMNKVK
jgi:hypothetical protein